MLLSNPFFNDTATTAIYTLSLHDALPIWRGVADADGADVAGRVELQQCGGLAAMPVAAFQGIQDHLLFDTLQTLALRAKQKGLELTFHIPPEVPEQLIGDPLRLRQIMVNLVGAEGYSGPVVYEGMEDILHIDGGTPHIYGKKQTRPFRKMGHVTIVNEDMEEAHRVAEKVKKSIRVISE